jgi:hypothetical protein
MPIKPATPVRRIIAVKKEPKKSCHLRWVGKPGDDPHQINTGFIGSVELHSRRNRPGLPDEKHA